MAEYERLRVENAALTAEVARLKISLSLADDEALLHRSNALAALKAMLRAWDLVAIRDAEPIMPRPSRIPEPGWGEFVRARTLGNGHEREFLRYKADDPDFRWADGCEQYLWADLIDPTLIRECVES